MTKYAFLSLPLHAHVNPTLPIAQDLVAGGDEVVYYTSGSFQKVVGPTGARLCAVEEPDDPTGDARERTLELRFRHVLPQLAKVVAEQEPDVIVYDNMFAPGHVIPSLLKKPAIQWRVVFAGNEHWNLAEEEARLAWAPEPIGAPVFDHMISAMNEARVAAGAQPLKCSRDVNQKLIGAFLEASEPLTIVFMPREYHPHGETFDEKRFYFAGPSFPAVPSTPDSIMRPLLDHMEGGPVLYISQGTVFNNDQPEFFDMCVEAFAGSRYRVVISRGDSRAEQKLHHAAPNVLVGTWLPQLEVVKRASAFLTQGGTDSVLQCLSFGVPLIVVPRQIEQAMHGARVAELGLGAYIPTREISAALMRRTVDEVLARPELAERTKAMQAATARAGSHAGAAEAIRRHVKRLA